MHSFIIHENLFIYLMQLTGIAYLSGNDPWMDLPRRLGLPLLQPNKIMIRDNNNPEWSQTLGLLAAMESCFTQTARNMTDLLESAKSIAESTDLSLNLKRNLNQASIRFLTELNDAIQILSLRAQQVNALYRSNDPTLKAANSQHQGSQQRRGREVIMAAQAIVKEREQYYRVPSNRIAAWRENPTVYRFGYLWAVHSLYYWWRYQGMTEQGSDQSEISPCYLNRMDVAEVAVGWGKYSLEWIRNILNRFIPFGIGHPFELINCFAPPQKEYVFPRDLYHHE
jgi:hypothetical protein